MSDRLTGTSTFLLPLYNKIQKHFVRLKSFASTLQYIFYRYLFDYLMGVKIYLLKERLENLSCARANLNFHRQVHFSVIAACWGVLTGLFAR